MDTEQWVSLLGGVAVAVAVRLSNVIVAGLARVFGVEAPEPIPTVVEAAPTPTGTSYQRKET